MRNLYKYERLDIDKKIKHFFVSVDTLVDVGCGIRPFCEIDANVHICIEPWKEYIDIISNCYPKTSSFVFLNTDAINGLKTFADKSVDSVCIIDVIEHLSKDDGYVLIKEAERIARKQIIIFTPLGYMSNHAEEKDGWGLNGGKMQEHLSGWLPEDFDEDWDIHICEKYHLKENHHIVIDRDYGCLWAIKNIKYNPHILKGTPSFVIENSFKSRKSSKGFFKKLFSKIIGEQGV